MLSARRGFEKKLRDWSYPEKRTLNLWAEKLAPRPRRKISWPLFSHNIPEANLLPEGAKT